MKFAILTAATVLGILGGWLGSLIGGGGQMGGAALLGSTIGSIAGIWVGYKVYKNYF